mmetsp:Transcript_597/g.663  ORF Transcript_597/g.663 Transcript_597/m.663 type:complete len:219 (-) Transcript_597:168-824(-)
MSDGGLLAWKRQQITGNPACDYSTLKNPLPNPPPGQTWVRDPETREWFVVDINVIEGVESSGDDTKQVNDVDNVSKGRVHSLQIDNKLKELLPDDCDYVSHQIEPSDTFQGICIKYGVSALTLRRLNKFSGSNLILAPAILTVPLKRHVGGSSTIVTKDTQISQFLNAFRCHEISKSLGRKEAIAYLDMHDGNLEAAIQDAKEDFGWELGENENSSLL